MGTCSSLRRRMMTGGGEVSLPNYLCFTALEDGTFTFKAQSWGGGARNIAYSIDDGRTWSEFSNIGNGATITTPSIPAGNMVYWRGNNSTMGTGVNANSQNASFSSTGKFNISGNIFSLLRQTNFEGIDSVPNYGFIRLFAGSKCVNTEDLILPAHTIGTYAYNRMFNGCTNLIYPVKELPSNSAKNSSYYGMYTGCTSLVITPNIKATSYAEASCYEMFFNCSSLEYSYQINVITISGTSMFMSMFRGCSKLSMQPFIISVNSTVANFLRYTFGNCKIQESPRLIAEDVAGGAYQQMFPNCGSLNYIYMLGTTLGNNALYNWVSGVASSGIFVKHIDATWTTTGASGVPNGWTIIYYDPAVDKYYTDQTKLQECDDHGNPI